MSLSPSSLRQDYPGAARGEQGAKRNDLAAHMAGTRATHAAIEAENRRFDAEKAPFNIGPGGVTQLAEEVASTAEFGKLIPGTIRVVGNQSAKSRPIAGRNLKEFAPKGTPAEAEKLHAIILNGHADTAWAVVTREDSSTHEGALALVELGFGVQNDTYQGRSGEAKDIQKGFMYDDEDGRVVEVPGEVRASIKNGQIGVESLNGEAMPIISRHLTDYPDTPGTKYLVDFLTANPNAWSMDSDSHSVLLGTQLPR